jgi:hypothetical protein
MDLKIGIATIFALCVSFSIVFVINYSFPDPIKNYERDFYNQDFAENKVFILGSSHVRQLNATFINDYVRNYDLDHTIYNLGKSGDKPLERIRTIQDISILKPDLVVYGISYRDFDVKSTEKELLPSPKKKFYTFLEEFFEEPINPKHSTFRIILEIADKMNLIHNPDIITVKNTPFVAFNFEHTLIADLETLKLQAKSDDAGLITSQKFSIENKQVKALINILEEFQKNGIKIVIVTSPLHKTFLDTLTESQKESFNSILDELAKKYNIEIYRLDEKYSELEIWYNFHHVALNKKSSIFYEDVSKIIIVELNK